jgi:hypothetical protein
MHACRSLRGVDIDKAEREIYIPLGSGGIDQATGMPTPPEALLLVDFDNSNVGELLRATTAGSWQRSQ